MNCRNFGHFVCVVQCILRPDAGGLGAFGGFHVVGDGDFHFVLVWGGGKRGHWSFRGEGCFEGKTTTCTRECKTIYQSAFSSDQWQIIHTSVGPRGGRENILI